MVGFGTLGLPQTAVRAMGFKNTKSMHQAMWIGVLTCSFVIVGMHLAGTWAGAFVDVDNLPTSDYFIPYIVQYHFLILQKCIFYKFVEIIL